MAQLPRAANTEGNKDTLDTFTPLPAGEYPVSIVKSLYKETKAKTGHYLELHMKVLMGEYKGRILFERLNLDNPNPIAVEIANKTLNTICQTLDKVGVEDSEELHGIPFIVKIKVIPETETNPASNNITAYSAADDIESLQEKIAEEATTKEESATSESKKKKLPWE